MKNTLHVMKVSPNLHVNRAPKTRRCPVFISLWWSLNKTCEKRENNLHAPENEIYFIERIAQIHVQELKSTKKQLCETAHKDLYMNKKKRIITKKAKI